MKINEYISVTEYAKMHGVDPSRIRHKIADGNVRTAIKIGAYWVIDKNEPYLDCRRKENKK